MRPYDRRGRGFRGREEGFRRKGFRTRIQIPLRKRIRRQCGGPVPRGQHALLRHRHGTGSQKGPHVVPQGRRERQRRRPKRTGTHVRNGQEHPAFPEKGVRMDREGRIPEQPQCDLQPGHHVRERMRMRSQLRICVPPLSEGGVHGHAGGGLRPQPPLPRGEGGGEGSRQGVPPLQDRRRDGLSQGCLRHRRPIPLRRRHRKGHCRSEEVFPKGVRTRFHKSQGYHTHDRRGREGGTAGCPITISKHIWQIRI